MIKEVFKGVALGFRLSGKHIVDCYVKIPIGLLIMLAVIYGVNEVILKTGINFPASVTCMLLLYLFLIISSRVLGKKKASTIIKYIEIPAGFSLRWINIFFTPAFMTLPKSENIGWKEPLIITAVFIIGYFVATVIIAYFTVLLQFLLGKCRKSSVERAEEFDQNEDYDLGATSTALLNKDSISHSTADSIADFTPTELQKIRSLDQVPLNILNDLPRGDETPIEEMYRQSMEHSRRGSFFVDIDELDDSSSRDSNVVQIEVTTNKSHQILTVPAISKPSPAVTKSSDSNPPSKQVVGFKKLFCKRAVLKQTQSHEQELDIRIGNCIHKHFDLFVLGFLFISGIPIYYAVPYEMFLHLSISIATFLFMLKAPPAKWKKILHPVLFSVGLSLLFYYIFAVMKKQYSIIPSIDAYKTGRNYLTLFNHKTTDAWPGAGDVFSSLMDVSIVSLSIPMYTYRNDLKKHFFALVPPILLMSCGCFFVYPPLCYHLGINPERSLGFAGRSVTLALGTPFVKALHGSVTVMACTTVISGVLGALTGQPVLKFLRIREDDYVTRGLTLGLNCGAIATAHLLTIDPRAAAISSLAFVLFGTIMVIFASIGPLSSLVGGWVNLNVTS